jgi:hypothetical protein
MAAVISVAPNGGVGAGITDLIGFREQVYGCLTKRPDALFGILDAVCCPVAVASLAHLSLADRHERRHGSVYAALTHGRIDAQRLRDELVLARDPSWPLVFGVDTCPWCRCDAECSPERGYYHHPARHSAGQPIVAGWCYSTLAQLNFAADSWTAPLDVLRLDPHPQAPGANQVAAGQIRALLGRLGDIGPVPWFVFDGGYDPVQLTVELAGTAAQILVRIKSDRIFHFPPGPRPPGRCGPPRRHGAKFCCADSTSWPEPDDVLVTTDVQYGSVTVAAWRELHPMQRTYREPGGAMTIVPGTLVRVQVEHLPGRIEREAKSLWLWWSGPRGATCDLDVAWKAYIRRFDLDHTYRFEKQQLGWTTPKVRMPEQADRWTWIVLIAYTMLRLARPLVGEHRLPWQPPLPVHRRTPGRVRRGFGHLLARIGTPARPPQPCGRPPGRPKGRRSKPAQRHPAIKKQP